MVKILSCHILHLWSDLYWCFWPLLNLLDDFQSFVRDFLNIKITVIREFFLTKLQHIKTPLKHLNHWNKFRSKSSTPVGILKPIFNYIWVLSKVLNEFILPNNPNHLRSRALLASCISGKTLVNPIIFSATKGYFPQLHHLRELLNPCFKNCQIWFLPNPDLAKL